METSLAGRRIEDRELGPTSTGHPRCEREDEAEGIRRRRERSPRESQESNFGRELRPIGGDNIGGASQLSDRVRPGNGREKSLSRP